MTPPEPRADYGGALYNRQYPDASWSCTIDHRDGDGNPVPCPDALYAAVPEPEQDTGYRRAGCSVFGWALLLALLLAGCSAQPAGNATPRTAPDLPAQSGAPLRSVSPAERDALLAHRLDFGSGAPLTPEVLAADVTYSGIVNYAEPGLGRWYLAIPDGKGVAVTICGPGGCLDRTSTDAGPALSLQRAGRIADLNSVDWAAIAGVPLRRGGFQGTILILKRPPRIELPQTDSTKEGE